MNKFYQAPNAHQAYKTKAGRRYNFAQYTFLGGTWHGVIVARTDEEKADLAEIAAANKAVKEIDEVEWARCIKLRAGYQPSNSPLAESRGKPQPQQVEPEPVPVPIKTIAPLATVEEALEVGNVEASPEVEPPPAPVKEAAPAPRRRRQATIE